jgi:hypothetical protein
MHDWPEWFVGCMASENLQERLHLSLFLFLFLSLGLCSDRGHGQCLFPLLWILTCLIEQ